MARQPGATSHARGFIRLKFLLTLIVVGGIAYVGIKLVPPYWDYLSMQDPVKEAAMAFARDHNEDEVRARLIASAKGVGVALEEDNVRIDQEGSLAVVRVAWEVPLDIPIYRRALRFRIEKAIPAP